MSTVGHHSTPVARKPHWCEQCGRRIEPGEKYYRWDGIYDGRATSAATCEQCVKFMRDLYAIEVYGEDENGNDSWPYLPEVDWADVIAISPLWDMRHERWTQKWAGQPYPEQVGA